MKYLSQSSILGKALVFGVWILCLSVFSVSAESVSAPLSKEAADTGSLSSAETKPDELHDQFVFERDQFVPEKGNFDTIQEMILELQRYHYRSVLLNQQFSEALLDHYFDELDPGRHFFLESDKLKLMVHGDRLALKLARSGDVGPMFEIYTHLHQTMLNRYRWLLDLCKQGEEAIAFSKEETIDLDRKQAQWPKSQEEADRLWLARHTHQVLNLMLAGKTTAEALELLEERYQRQLDHLKQIRSDDVFTIVANAISTFYDPHSQYLSPRDSENFAIRMNLSLEGIGTVLQRDGEYTKILSVVPGGPADLSKQIKAGDRIVAVAQGKEEAWTDIIGWRLDDVVPLIRGSKGTTVRLEVIPVDAVDTHQTKIVSIVRNEVKLEEQAAQKEILSVEYSGTEKKVGVIKVPAFYINFEEYRAQKPDYRSTTRDVKALLQQLDQEEVAGVVIDLRDNGGGSLEEAITLSGLFVPPGGPVVQISYGKGRQQAIPARPTEYHSRLPVVVLVNRISASASEIFAAALQDYRRAVIVGERTFGKGTVQRIVALDKGQLKYTNATFYRIDGNTTQHQGVVPDIELPSYYDHDQIGESALSRAMPAGQIKSAQFTPVKNWLPPLERLLSRHQARAESDPELIFLKEDVQRIQNARQKREWVLDYETRLEEMEADKVLRLEMENRKRKLAGLEALESLDELDEKRIGKSAVLEEIPEEAEIVGSENEEGDELDVVLLEAARILLDMEVELASLHETRTADAK